MKIETKFDIGDTVYYVYLDRSGLSSNWYTEQGNIIDILITEKGIKYGLGKPIETFLPEKDIFISRKKANKDCEIKEKRLDKAKDNLRKSNDVYLKATEYN